MNSPDLTISPLDSASSESPPPEEVIYQSSSNAGYLSNLTSHITNTLARTTGVGGSSSKRRLPGSSFASGPSDRDPKARKKTGDTGRNNSQYEGGPRDISTKKDKEELVDTGTVEWLRKGCYFTLSLYFCQ